MNIDRITEFFFERASKRIRMKIAESGLTLNKVYSNDEKQISRIINNKRTRNNPFLICDSAISSRYKDESSGEYNITGLSHSLDFKNTKEILWGTNEEIKSYIYDLFILLWEEIYMDRTIELDKELILCDYIPYARCKTYYDILYNSDRNDIRFFFAKCNEVELNYPAVAFGVKEDYILDNIDNAREEAILFLYNRCKDIFYSSFIQFTNETLSFHMINKTIKKSFIEKQFIPLLIDFMPDEESLGLRVRNLINGDLSYCAALSFGNSIGNEMYHKELIKASTAYIDRLEEIQASIFKINRK